MNTKALSERTTKYNEKRGIVLDKNKLQGLIYELRNLKDKVVVYKDSNEYIYTSIYKTWINDYNNILTKLMQLQSLK